MIIVYAMVLTGFLVDMNWHRIPYFRTKKLLNLAIAQRLLLPVLPILPAADTYHLIIFLNAFAAIEVVFYARSNSKTKHYVYSMLHLLHCILTGVYIAVELSLNRSQSSYIAAVCATIALAVFLLAFAVETLLGVKDRCWGGGKVENR